MADVLTNDRFRNMFPEFGSIEAYPDVLVNSWIEIAGSALPSRRWGNFLVQGLGLYVAHNLALGARAKTGSAGAVSGPMSSKTVGSVSASYDTSAVTIAGGGEWNLTSYGIRFWRIMRLVGAGGIQL